jgi:DNA polymerase I-like protein with 3'-5' exonuclease and polymerase domains
MSEFLFYHTTEDAGFLGAFKPLLKGNKTFLRHQTPVAVTEMLMEAKKLGVRQVITTNPAVVKLLRPGLGTQDDFAGSLIERSGVEFLILNPANHIFTVNYGKFLMERYLSKFTAPAKWFKQTAFKWELANESTIAELYDLLCLSLYCAIDIETLTEDRRISCVSYTCIYIDIGVYHTHTFVIALTSEFWLAWMRKCNATPVPKIFQNGKYDNAYFFRYSAPIKAWYFDTANLFHCWYSELPKRLDFLASFAIRKIEFWKNEGKTGNLEDYFRYNARDGWATANAFLGLVAEIPDYAINNYIMEFPLVFPCHQAEMTGIQIDLEQLEKLRGEQTEKLVARKAELGIMVGAPISKKTGESLFNPSSPPQVKRLMQVLGCPTDKGTGEIQLKKAMFQHPFNTRIFNAVLEYRKARKLVSTYLVPEKFWKGRCYYAINPHGTDTTRLASTESQFAGWGEDTTLAGLQIHNIPRDRPDIEVKSMFIADTGFLFGEGDYKQAEARDTGYLSGDTNLIAAVDSPKDFHAINVEGFFGLSYASIYDDTNQTVLNETIRYLSKRTNHGASYNMGDAVLVDTMGLENIYKAQKLLGLSSLWGPKKIAQYLLDCYDKRYPGVRGAYYDYIKYTIKTTHQLISPLGWTRQCFGNPEKNRQDLNSYVAHPSQNLNAGTLNKAWMRVFKEVALKEPKDFKLCAQIHDSILFQYRVGRDDLVRRVAECMLFSVRVKDCKGIERDLRVPVDMKAGARVWSEVKSFKL